MSPSPITEKAQQDGLVVDVFRDPADPARKRAEEDLSNAGCLLPLPHRSEWSLAGPGPSSWFFAVRDETHRYCFGFAAGVAHSRALPGHLLLRVERFRPTRHVEAMTAGLSALAELAQGARRILRVRLEIFERDAALARAAAECAQEAGFSRTRNGRCYVETVGLDLEPSESEIFASLHSTARQNIRAVDKNPTAVRPILEPSYADRMQALLEETIARTGSRAPSHDWARTIEFCRGFPNLSRLAGLFRTDVSGPQSLIAFGWGCHHGDHAHYSTAASTRLEDLRMPYGYGPIWDLILWAKRAGASWYDMGGITRGHADDADDRLGGISDFKRYFSREILEVGQEWALEPHPVRAKIAKAVGAGARALSRLRS